MTVTPRRQSRREPIDKEQMSKNGVLKITDQRRISGLSPVWMHDQSAHGLGKPAASGQKVAFKGVPASYIFRKENSRLLLVDAD